MTDLYFVKTHYGLVPCDQETFDYIAKMEHGQVLTGEFRQARNYLFLKKFFALLKIGFDAWEPTETEYKGFPVQKNFDRFRKDVIISAGYYDYVANIKGEVRADAKSISFAKMGEEEFAQLYSNVANVLLEKVMKNYTQADLDRVVQEILNFT